MGNFPHQPPGINGPSLSATLPIPLSVWGNAKNSCLSTRNQHFPTDFEETSSCKHSARQEREDFFLVCYCLDRYEHRRGETKTKEQKKKQRIEAYRYIRTIKGILQLVVVTWRTRGRTHTRLTDFAWPACLYFVLLLLLLDTYKDEITNTTLTLCSKMRK